MLGAALFGAGWGLAGLCPGPALVSLPSARVELLGFVAVMLASLFAVRAWDTRRLMRLLAEAPTRVGDDEIMDIMEAE